MPVPTMADEDSTPSLQSGRPTRPEKLSDRIVWHYDWERILSLLLLIVILISSLDAASAVT
jgi:hypothetical protein